MNKKKVVNVIVNIGVGISVFIAGWLFHLILGDIQEDKMMARLENTACLLLQTRSAIENFCAKNDRFPRSASELGLGSSYDIDPMSEEPLIWASNEQWQRLEENGVNRNKSFPLVWQPKPFRNPFLPFSRQRQYALFSDWSIRDMLAEEGE